MFQAQRLAYTENFRQEETLQAERKGWSRKRKVEPGAS